MPDALLPLLNSPELFVKILFLLGGMALGLIAVLVMLMIEEGAMSKASAKKHSDIAGLMHEIRKTVEAGPPKGRHTHRVNGKFAKRGVA